MGKRGDDNTLILDSSVFDDVKVEFGNLLAGLIFDTGVRYAEGYVLKCTKSEAVKVLSNIPNFLLYYQASKWK